MKIIVTEQDIRIGNKADCNFCPIALAGQRALGRPVTVSCYNIYGGRNDRYPLPKKAQEFICLFDKGEKVGPFEFEVFQF